jgi:hypothetical protein
MTQYTVDLLQNLAIAIFGIVLLRSLKDKG